MFCKNCGKEIVDRGNFCPHCGYNSNPNAILKSSEYKLASVGLRFANYILDYVFSIIFLIVLIIVFRLILKDELSELFTSIGSFLFFVIYYFLFEGIWQRTPAKFITKTKVVMEDGSKPDFLHILGRSFSRIIPFEPFSFLAGPRGWHDSLSKTLVVSKDYTPEQIKQIDLKNQPKTSAAIIIVIVVFISIAVIGLLSSVVLLALNSARAKSRDAKRLADVRQVASALELYFNDNSKYPTTLNDLGSKYIGTLPIPPTPPDGECNSENNKYRYVLYSSDNYQLTFCLGAATGGYPAGVRTLTPQGISQNSNSDSNVLANINEWKPFNAADGSFKASLPTSPTRDDQSEKTEDGITVYTTTYSSEVSDSEAYLIAVYKYSDVLDFSNEDAVLERILNGMASTSSNNELISSNYSYHGNNRSLDYLVQQGDTFLKGRFIIAGQTLYGIMHIYKSGAYNETDYNKFLDSFVVKY